MVGWILAATVVSTSSVAAQKPLERLPEGRQSSGWAIEAISVDRSVRSSAGITAYAGQIGLKRISTGPSSFSSSQLDGLGSTPQHLVFNGRAFFRVREPQRYVFVVSASANIITGGASSCEFAMSVGERWVINGRFSTVRERDARRLRGRGHEVADGAVLNGFVQLEPGYYRIEFVTGCPNSYQAADLRVEFSVRSEFESAPRQFQTDELFNVSR
jgi:hypothetical protein